MPQQHRARFRVLSQPNGAVTRPAVNHSGIEGARMAQADPWETGRVTRVVTRVEEVVDTGRRVEDEAGIFRAVVVSVVVGAEDDARLDDPLKAWWLWAARVSFERKTSPPSCRLHERETTGAGART